MARELDLYLERYGRNITRQVKVSVDWQADPRRMNNTWEPWIPPGEILYPTNTAAHLVSFIYCLHIGLVLVTAAHDPFV